MIGILTASRKLHETKGKGLSISIAYEQKLILPCEKKQNEALEGCSYNSSSRSIFNKEGHIEGPLGFYKF